MTLSDKRKSTPKPRPAGGASPDPSHAPAPDAARDPAQTIASHHDGSASTVDIGGIRVRPGERRRIELPVALLPTQTPMTLPVEVVNGVEPGPRLWISAALHGDELNGVEIIHRILEKVGIKSMRGELITAPIVNVFGFIHQSRYLLDGRDLNRCFPGTRGGSLASRLASLFMREIVGRCTHGIDLHTAGGHRINLPQVRGNLHDPGTRRLAEAFAAPIMIHGEAPPGSLRAAVARKKIPVIVYEAGEPHRFNRDAINLGVKGVLRVMRALGMIDGPDHRPRQSMEATRRTWVRATRSGLIHLQARLGRWVSEGQTLAVIRDAFGDNKSTQKAPCDGLVIGMTNHPMVSQGDAIVHLARDVKTQTLSQPSRT